MTVEKAKGVPDIAEGLSSVVGDFSKKLKELMGNIMKPINKLLEDLGFKEKKEKDDVIDSSKIDLNKLMKDVKSDVEIDQKLTDKEKNILDGLVGKNKDLKIILNRTKKEFGEDIQKRESAVFMSMLKKETYGGKIEQSKLDDIIKNMKENKEQIEKDEKLKNIIIQIKKDDNLKEKHSLKAIVDAYNKTKKQINDGENKQLDKNSILENIVNFES